MGREGGREERKKGKKIKEGKGREEENTLP